MSNPYGFPDYVIERVLAKRGRLRVFDRFDAKRTALLVIDMQNFYVGEIASVVGIIPNINRLASTVREKGGLVVWIGMTAGSKGESRWRIYHDHFFTPEKGANHRDQLSPENSATPSTRISISVTANPWCGRTASAHSSPGRPTSRMCFAQEA